jgi:pyruvate/2-oxoglutarate dehydrogenase complex dihydrolipoamide dehydrogenase (E3) component
MVPTATAMSSLKPASLWLMIAVTTGQTTRSQLSDVLVKDVVIIGGGASGAYAGVRLRDDFGKSVAIVEMQDRLVSKATQQLNVD